MKAVEVKGRVDERHQLHLDAPLPPIQPGPVRVIILSPEQDNTEADDTEWLSVVKTNPVFDFLKDPAEDIYTAADGKPFRDQG